MLPDLRHLPRTVEISIKATLHALEAGALLRRKSRVEGTLHVFPILLQVHPVVPDETHFLLCHCCDISAEGELCWSAEDEVIVEEEGMEWRPIKGVDRHELSESVLL